MKLLFLHLRFFNNRNICVELCSERNKLTDSDVLLTLNKLTAKGKLMLYFVFITV